MLTVFSCWDIAVWFHSPRPRPASAVQLLGYRSVVPLTPPTPCLRRTVAGISQCGSTHPAHALPPPYSCWDIAVWVHSPRPRPASAVQLLGYRSVVPLTPPTPCLRRTVAGISQCGPTHPAHALPPPYCCWDIAVWVHSPRPRPASAVQLLGYRSVGPLTPPTPCLRRTVAGISQCGSTHPAHALTPPYNQLRLVAELRAGVWRS